MQKISITITNTQILLRAGTTEKKYKIDEKVTVTDPKIQRYKVSQGIKKYKITVIGYPLESTTKFYMISCDSDGETMEWATGDIYYMEYE